MSVLSDKQEMARGEAVKVLTRWKNCADKGVAFTFGLGLFFPLQAFLNFLNGAPLVSHFMWGMLAGSFVACIVWRAAAYFQRRQADYVSLLTAGIAADDAKRMVQTMSNSIMSDRLAQEYEDMERLHGAALQDMQKSFERFMSGFGFRPSFVQRLQLMPDGRKTYFLHRFFRFGVPGEIVALTMYKRFSLGGQLYNGNIFTSAPSGKKLEETSVWQARLNYWFGYGVSAKIMSGVVLLIIAPAIIYGVVFRQASTDFIWACLAGILTIAAFIWIYLFISKRVRGNMRTRITFQSVGLLCFGVLFFLTLWFSSVFRVFLSISNVR